jgi:drug/metabolite transporter (DMT)-like permease
MRIPTKEEWKRLAYIGFFSTFLYQVFFMFGMKYTAAGDASLMITFNPIITALLAIPFLGEKMTKRLASGLILALIWSHHHFHLFSKHRHSSNNQNAR